MVAIRKSGGANVALTGLKRKAGGVEVAIQNGYRRSGGTWVGVYSAYTPVSVSLSKTTLRQFGSGPSASGPSGQTSPTTATPAGGNGGYTYAWTRISGDASTNITNTNTASVQFNRASCSGGVNYVSVWRCTVSDGTSSAYADVTVTLGYTQIV